MFTEWKLSRLYNKFPSYFWIVIVSLVSTFFLWLPFLLRFTSWFGLVINHPSFDYIYRQFDGLFYIIPAKTFYDVNKIDIPGKGLILSLPLGTEYFAAHLPLYPVFIRLFAYVFGYLKSMLVVNIVFTVLLASFFYHMVKTFKLTSKPMLLTMVFLFLPRFLVVRSTGAPESLFILLVLISLYFWEQEQYVLASLMGFLAVTTKTPGILLFAVYGLCVLERYYKTKKIHWHWFSIVLIPLGLLAVFGLYSVQFHDFFAYFHTAGVVPMPYPFAAFNFQAKWVGTAWLEDIVFYLFLYLLTVIALWKSHQRSFFYFSLVFFTALTFVQHRDISRYSLPLWPIALVAFEKFFTSKKFMIALIILLPAIYLYAWNFLLYNVVPIADWRPFM